jgi:hypothetical protein
MKADLFWIPGPWRGNLAIAARPGGGDWLNDEGSAWRQAGVDLIFSLLQDDELTQLGLANERQAVENQGISFLSFPIPRIGCLNSYHTGVGAPAPAIRSKPLIPILRQ